MRGIHSLISGVPERESVAQVVVVLDADVASWLAGWISAHMETQYPWEQYPRELADVLKFADRYDYC